MIQGSITTIEYVMNTSTKAMPASKRRKMSCTLDINNVNVPTRNSRVDNVRIAESQHRGVRFRRMVYLLNNSMVVR